MPGQQEGSIRRHHQLIEAFANREIRPEETSFNEIHEFIQKTYDLSISRTLQERFALSEQVWGYLYIPNMDVWTFVGGNKEIPETIDDATAIITTNAWLMPKTNEPRKGIQISGVDHDYNRAAAIMYEQPDGIFIRGDVSISEKELPFDFDIDRLLKPTSYPYYLAGIITPKMLAATDGHTKIIRLRGRMPDDSLDTKHFFVEGTLPAVRLPNFRLLESGDSYDIAAYYEGYEEAFIIAAFPINIAT